MAKVRVVLAEYSLLRCLGRFVVGLRRSVVMVTCVNT